MGVYRWKKWDLLPQGAFSLGWQMYDHLTLIPCVRWWKATKTRKNLKEDLNKEEELSRLTGGSGIPGRRISVGRKGKVKRSEHDWCFWGTHPVSRCRGAEREGWKWWGHLLEVRLDKSVLSPPHRAPYLRILSPILSFPQVLPFPLESIVIIIIYEWVLLLDKIVNHLMSRMMSLIIYNPNSTQTTTLHKYFAHLNRIHAPMCMI